MCVQVVLAYFVYNSYSLDLYLSYIHNHGKEVRERENTEDSFYSAKNLNETKKRKK